MFSQRPRRGKFERLVFVAVYVLAIAIGERAGVSPGGDWQFLRNGFAEATRLYVMFSDEACLFNNVFVGDGAIRVATSCAVIHGPGDE
ncbi:hypothetical protein SB861_25920 [Paraburkholderia sp. SIMBA_049]